MADPIVIPGVPVPIPNPFDPNAPIFNPGGQTDPNNLASIRFRVRRALPRCRAASTSIRPRSSRSDRPIRR
jgi:hypothetical protein